MSLPTQTPDKKSLRTTLRFPLIALKRYGVIILSILLLLALLGSGVLYWQYRTTRQLLWKTQNPDPAQEATQLVSEVSELMLLPSETPTVATVTDKAALSAQEFFAPAENGDKVLIFTEAKKAILYRPSQKKIVNVAPLITQNSVSTPTPDTKLEPSISLALLNGSTQVGITNVLDDQLVTAFPTLKVTSKSPAQKNDYQGNLVIDLTGKNATLVQDIAQKINGRVGSLPEGENRPTADILLIVGNSSSP